MRNKFILSIICWAFVKAQQIDRIDPFFFVEWIEKDGSEGIIGKEL